MNLHEYQSKELFAEYAIPIPQAGSRLAGGGCRRCPESRRILWVSKHRFTPAAEARRRCQVVKDLEAVRAAAKAMLGTTW